MSAQEIRRNARYIMSDNSPNVYLVSLLFVVLITVMSGLQDDLLGISRTLERYFEQVAEGNFASIFNYISIRPGGIPLAIAIWLLTTVLQVGYMSYSMKIARAEEADAKDIFNGFYYFGKVLMIHLITRFMVLLWSLLFVIPGVMAEYSYRQVYYILLDDPEKSVFQCISESTHLMRGQRLELFMLDFSFIGWQLLDSSVQLFLLSYIPIPLPIVLIWLTPYTHLASVVFYNRKLTQMTL